MDCAITAFCAATTRLAAPRPYRFKQCRLALHCPQIMLLIIFAYQPAAAAHARLAEAFQRLYPPSEYDMRNAKSRTDGYWPYISRKEEPPLVNTCAPLRSNSSLVHASHSSLCFVWSRW